MNNAYESTLIEQPVLNRIESKDEDHTVQALGTLPRT